MNSNFSKHQSFNSSLERLNRELEDLLDPCRSQTYSFMSYVKRCIKQYNLVGRLQPNDVINESYKRAVLTIQKGEKIENFKAWLRKTSLNIVRENSRRLKKSNPTNPQSDIFENNATFDDKNIYETFEEARRLAENQKKLKIFKEALSELKKLDPDSVQLLRWRLVENQTWADIKDYLEAKKTGNVPNIQALRKRASRAKTKLREIYHRIEQELAEAKVSK